MIRFALAAAAVVVSVPAQSAVLGFTDRLVQPGSSEVDYTVLPDGFYREIHFDLESTDPNARFELYAPNQVQADAYVRTANGSELIGVRPDIIFLQVFQPLKTIVKVRAPAPYNNCDQPGIIGEICGLELIQVWGNGGAYTLHSDVPAFVRVTVALSHAPEPATWGMMILGFAMTGSAARKLGRSQSGSRNLPQRG